MEWEWNDVVIATVKNGHIYIYIYNIINNITVLVMLTVLSIEEASDDDINEWHTLGYIPIINNIYVHHIK